MPSLEKSFFPGARRRYTLADYKPLKTAGKEFRKKLVIDGHIEPDGSQVGMPTWIGEPYLLLQKDGCLSADIKLDAFELAPMALDIHATDKGKRPALRLSNCTLSHFSVWKSGTADKATFGYRFVCHTPDTVELHEWLRLHYMADFFGVFEPAQGELALDSKPGDGEEEEEDEDDDEVPEHQKAAERAGSRKRVQ